MHDYLVCYFDPAARRWHFFDGQGMTAYISSACLLTKREAKRIQGKEQPYRSHRLEIKHHKEFHAV